jgi:hypothetical protein
VIPLLYTAHVFSIFACSMHREGKLCAPIETAVGDAQDNGSGAAEACEESRQPQASSAQGQGSPASAPTRVRLLQALGETHLRLCLSENARKALSLLWDLSVGFRTLLCATLTLPFFVFFCALQRPVMDSRALHRSSTRFSAPLVRIAYGWNRGLLPLVSQ